MTTKTEPRHLTHKYEKIYINHGITIDELAEIVSEAREKWVDVTVGVTDCEIDIYRGYYDDAQCDHVQGYLYIDGWSPLSEEVKKQRLEEEEQRKKAAKEATAKRKITEATNAKKRFQKLVKERPELVKAFKDNGDISLPVSKLTTKMIQDAHEIQRLAKKYPNLLKDN